MAEIALGWHVGAHDLVATLRHPMNVLAAPFRVEAEPDDAGADFLANFLNLGKVLVNFGAGLVQCFYCRA